MWWVNWSARQCLCPVELYILWALLCPGENDLCHLWCRALICTGTGSLRTHPWSIRIIKNAAEQGCTQVWERQGRNSTKAIALRPARVKTHPEVARKDCKNYLILLPSPSKKARSVTHRWLLAQIFLPCSERRQDIKSPWSSENKFQCLCSVLVVFLSIQPHSGLL